LSFIIAGALKAAPVESSAFLPSNLKLQNLTLISAMNYIKSCNNISSPGLFSGCGFFVWLVCFSVVVVGLGCWFFFCNGTFSKDFTTQK